MAVKLIDELQKEIKAAGEAVTQEAYTRQPSADQKKLTGMHTIPSMRQWICWKKDWRTKDSYSEIM